MKMMSWSRYHYRPWSPLCAVRRRRRAKPHLSRPDHHGGAENQPKSGADGSRSGYFEFNARLFRT
jgi:hypothetical protein